MPHLLRAAMSSAAASRAVDAYVILFMLCVIVKDFFGQGFYTLSA